MNLLERLVKPTKNSVSQVDVLPALEWSRELSEVIGRRCVSKRSPQLREVSADLMGSRSLVLSPSHVLSPPRNLELSEFLQQLLGRGFGVFVGEGRPEPPGWEQIALGCISRCELRLAQALALRLLLTCQFLLILRRVQTCICPFLASLC